MTRLHSVCVCVCACVCVSACVSLGNRRFFKHASHANDRFISTENRCWYSFTNFCVDYFPILIVSTFKWLLVIVVSIQP